MRRSPMRRVASRRAGLHVPTRNELDQLARTAVMMRAGAHLFTDEGRRQWWGPCQRCFKVDWLSWCHVFTRASYSVRWDMNNAFAWCRGCHRWMDQHWEAKRDYAIEKLGEVAFKQVQMRARGRSRIDYMAVKLYLQDAIDRMRGTAQ